MMALLSPNGDWQCNRLVCTNGDDDNNNNNLTCVACELFSRRNNDNNMETRTANVVDYVQQIRVFEIRHFFVSHVVAVAAGPCGPRCHYRFHVWHFSVEITLFTRLMSSSSSYYYYVMNASAQTRDLHNSITLHIYIYKNEIRFFIIDITVCTHLE